MMAQHRLANNQLPISTLARTGACARIFQLETGITARTNFGSITNTLHPRRCGAIGARALVGFALAFIVAHLPPSVTTRHFTPLAVALGIANTAS